MSTTHISKKPRLGSNEDRITNLHETVISHILSRLLTRDAVRTSILSKDWKYKWTFLYNIEIDDRYAINHNDESFVKFMNLLLSSCKHIKSFNFTCWRFKDSGCIQTWFSDVLRHKVENFLSNEHRCGSGRSVIYPCSLLNSTSLKKLWLGHSYPTLEIAVTNCVPNLTNMYLYEVQIVNRTPSSSTVTFNFPVLQLLEFRCCQWLHVKCVEINAPLLTTFKSKPQAGHYGYSFKIFAPKLTTFKCSNGLLENFDLDGSSVISASLVSDGTPNYTELLETTGLRARILLNRLTSLENLELSSYMTEAMLSTLPLHPHEKLTRLTFLKGVHVGQIFEYLHAAPSLNLLAVSVSNLDDYDYEAMELVPSCITSHLEVVVFQDFDNDIRAYDLAKFMLKNAEHLKEFVILGNCSHFRQLQFKEVISTYPRCCPLETIDIREKY